jgi:uridine phosphorylase
MRSFFDPSAPVLTPAELVLAFTGATPEALLLPRRAVIVFTPADLSRLVRETGAEPVPVWLPFRRLYRPRGRQTVLARSPIGGPAVAALVEELAAFRVREFCLWGYCGGISADVSIGDAILATAAFREEGVSSHYLESEDELVGSEWAAQWELPSEKARILTGAVWTSDALYRETADKVAAYAERGVLGVEMEVASLYAVCKHKGLKAVAFLVVSDVVRPNGWQSGFKSVQLQKGVARLSAYIRKYVIA